MRVDDPETERLEMPEECDRCDIPVPLKRYVSYGPGHQVEWLCHYCESMVGTASENRALVQGLHVLERRIVSALQQPTEPNSSE